MSIPTGDFYVVENPPHPKSLRILSLHYSIKAAFKKRNQLRKKSAEPWRYTVNHVIAYSSYPGPVIDEPK